ncbi:hypothetical protein ACEV8V_24805 [Vibrio parahaemolyticus]|nr:hypothetical protein [Vibrio parahaemolyticus]
MIQEPTNSTFPQKAVTRAERGFKAKIWLLFARNLTSRNFSEYRVSANLPFPHFAPDSFPHPIAIFNEATSRTLACMTVSVIQEFEPTMLICRQRKTNDQRERN